MHKKMSWQEVCSYLFKKYATEFDSINEVMDFSDTLNATYSNGGDDAVEKLFLPAASLEYKNDFKKLIIR